MKASTAFRIAVDIGGTFTDGVLQDAAADRILLAKALTTYDNPGNAVGTVVRDLLAQCSGSAAGSSVGEVVHATTLVTNAIIERRGDVTALIVTRGFRDTLDIRREDRYDLFDLDIPYPAPLVDPENRIEVDERIGADGDVVTALDATDVQDIIDRLREINPGSVAICLLHAYVNESHERQLAGAIQAALPDVPVTLSSETAREIREYERMSTAVANAFVQPRMARYLTSLNTRLAEQEIAAPLRIMVSSGGFTSPEFAVKHPVKLLESGPAAGVLSALNTGNRAGVEKLLAFDMGGTTAKACVAIDGKPEITSLFEAGRMKRFAKGSGLPIIVPSIDLIEIGAGGGSIARMNELGLLQVGPESAASEPGPACYDRGGENPTVTDADLLLGYLDPDFFLGGKMALSLEAAERAMAQLAETLGMTARDVAVGINDLVNENMAGAARVHVAEKGFDPRGFSLVATGGAGPVHAVEVAHKLGIRHVLCSIAAGNGSCLGLLVAPARVDRSWSRVELLDTLDWPRAQAALDEHLADARGELEASNVDRTSVSWHLIVEMRFAGQGDTISVPFEVGPLAETVASIAADRFADVYRTLFGDLLTDSEIEVVTWRLVGQTEGAPQKFSMPAGDNDGMTTMPIKSRAVYLPDRSTYAEIPVYDRYRLPIGTQLAAPLILQETESTIVIARDARVTIFEDYSVSIELGQPEPG